MTPSDSNPNTRHSPWELAVGPPPEKWGDWVELDADAWPERKQRHYRCVPTICFNCESACGLLAFVDKESGAIQKFEGNPVHPGSRGRTCAKGPATINQIRDPERITTPLKRVGNNHFQHDRQTFGRIEHAFRPAQSDTHSAVFQRPFRIFGNIGIGHDFQAGSLIRP